MKEPSQIPTILSNGLKVSIHQILQSAERIEGWSLQGLGMLRLYLSREIRLHVWDGRHAASDADTIHTHPWNFVSYVVSGEVRQFRYQEWRTPTDATRAFKKQVIRCGPGGCAVGEPELVHLYRNDLEVYRACQSYQQTANEIHESFPVPGTVTVIERAFNGDTEHANVYFDGETWGSAEPRPATSEEVASIVGLALRRWGR